MSAIATVRLDPVSARAFVGRAVALRRVVRDAETAVLGEAVATAFLLRSVRSVVKAGHGHAALDLVAPPWAVEVKAGLVSNTPRAQVWRLTIGEPSPEERAWLLRAHPDDKRLWNADKQAAILRRKELALARVSTALGEPLTAKTVTVILDPDRQYADVFEFIGWHARIAWESSEATRGYRGSFHYAEQRNGE